MERIKLSPSLGNNVPPHPLVLVVDDEIRIIRFVRINLEMEGFEVIEAHDGLEALDKVRKIARCGHSGCQNAGNGWF